MPMTIGLFCTLLATACASSQTAKKRGERFGPDLQVRYLLLDVVGAISARAPGSSSSGPG